MAIVQFSISTFRLLIEIGRSGISGGSGE